MRNYNNVRLRILERHMAPYMSLKNIAPPAWISSIRKGLNLTLEQLGKKLGISRQGVRKLEEREFQGSITLKSLQAVANALDLIFVYGFVPKDDSIEDLVERKARELASKIVLRTHQNMVLEDQGNSEDTIEKAIEELTAELKREVRRSIWD